MTTPNEHPLRGLDEDVALRSIVEGTATATGTRFFSALVETLARTLKTQGAWVTEFLEEERRLRALAFWMEGSWIEDYEYDISGTPCQRVVESGRFVHHPENIIELYPDDPDLVKFRSVSFMGAPLVDLDGRVLGHLALLDTRPIPEDARILDLVKVFAARATAEVQRLRAEAKVHEREEQLAGLVDSVMDAIIQLDRDLSIVRVNPAAEKLFRCPASGATGKSFGQFLTSEAHDKLRELIRDVDALPGGKRSLWISGGLRALRTDGTAFQAEATLSRFDMHRDTYHTLILRSVDERLEAERKIRSLTNEAEYLREEIRNLQGFDDIVGRSTPLLRVLEDLTQVAETDATVLIYGETGTGKELIARAIHAASPRSDAALIKVNCAAIPTNLMESEFFGHEKGAFTGATEKRDGRFALADGGTIFLDEVGELSRDLQVKLLRVLQEGEFEPVGSSTTRRVDVRVIAATNRDLRKEVKEGNFREDLYYRLNVFPLDIPPLRERGDDIALLADGFARKLAGRMGRTVEPLSPDDKRRLKSYHWPGNVRELQNVIERALITSRGGRLNLDRALPETSGEARGAGAASADEAEHPIRTVKELQALEKTNYIRALEACEWRVSGENGAARRLGMNPSTLNSRMRALGIRRP